MAVMLDSTDCSATPRHARTHFATAWVLGVWALASAGGFWLVATTASSVPFGDEWVLVPLVIGRQPLSAHWLWVQHNEHRLPLPKLIQVGLIRAAGLDFRATAYINVVLLSGAALAGVWTAARLRGRPSLADAFIPLTLLSWAHAENFFWGWQVQFVLSTVLVTTFVLAVIQGGRRPVWKASVAAGLATVLLPLCGANGVVMTLPLAAAVGAIGRRHWRQGSRWLAGFMAVAATAALTLLALYLAGWQRVPKFTSAEPLLAVGMAVEFAGPAIGRIYPAAWLTFAIIVGCAALLVDGWAGWHWPRPRAVMKRLAGAPTRPRSQTLGDWVALVAAGVAVVAFVGIAREIFVMIAAMRVHLAPWLLIGLATLAPLVGGWKLSRQVSGAGDLRRQGIVVAVAGVLAMGAAIGWARSAIGFDLHNYPRYALLATPLWLACYLAWIAYAPSRGWPVGPYLFLAIALLAATNAIPSGLSVARQRRVDQLGPFLADLERGLTAAAIAERNTGRIYAPQWQAPLAKWIWALREAGHPSFQHVHPPSGER